MCFVLFGDVHRIQLTPAPTKDVPFTAGLALGVGAAMDLGSPPLSTKVFLLGSGSLAVIISNDAMSLCRHDLHDAPNNLCFRELGGAIFDINFDRALFCDSEISARPIFGGEGIRLPGGFNCELRY